jgi:hypothetical protein
MLQVVVAAPPAGILAGGGAAGAHSRASVAITGGFCRKSSQHSLYPKDNLCNVYVLLNSCTLNRQYQHVQAYMQPIS